MNKIKNNKGFTLVELLIVIAIIGILASALLVSLNGARQSARDARRIADLKQVQSALELYSAKCYHYPGDGACGAPTGGSPNGIWNGSIPGDLYDTLKTAIGSKIPKDIGTFGYSYFVKQNGQGYILSAQLETDNSALNNDIDNADINPADYFVSPSCDDSGAGGTRMYCVEF